MLILQLAVVTSAQETVRSPGPAPVSSAPPTGKLVAESSQSQDRSGAGGSTNGAITQPGKAGGMGDPAFGGERHPLYRLSKLDAVDLNFTFSPDFNQSLTVQPDGFVALKGAGTLLVEGLTIPQMQQAVADAVKQGVTVVRSSRVGAGHVMRNGAAPDDALGSITAGALNPYKARVLLMLALAAGTALADLQRVFDTY